MIRKATEKDIDKINKLGLELNPNFLITYNIKKYLEDNKYIVLVDEYINSFLIVFVNIDFYELETIVVDKDYRRKGLASNLLNFFLKNYGKIKDAIFLEVAINNESAINLYRKYGFEIVNIRKKYYNDIDAYVMKKVI